VLNNISKLINNSGKNQLITNIQANKPLLVKGYSPLRIQHNTDKIQSITFNIDFEADNNPNTYKAYFLQPEVLNIFPLYSILYKEDIYYLGESLSIEINPAKIDYSIFRDIKISKNIKNQISEKININDYYSFAVYKDKNTSVTIIIPCLAIGSFFYFPNSYVKRAFTNQNILNIIDESLSDCKNGAICLKSGVKFDRNTVTLSYLYYCDKYAKKYFYNAFAYYVKNKAKEDENKSYSNPGFKIPLANVFEGGFRGEYLDDKHFLAYQIIDIDFKRVFGKDEIIGFYEGRTKSEIFTTRIFKRLKGANSSISHTVPHNPHFRKTDIETQEEILSYVNKLFVRKGKAVNRGERLYSLPVNKLFKEIEGVSLSDTEDIESHYGKGNVVKFEFNFIEIIDLLEKKLPILNTNFYETSTHYIFHFVYKNRYYLLFELKHSNSSTLLFSSEQPINHKYIIRSILDIKEGNPKTYNDFGKEVYEKHGICFHIPQKHTGKDINVWIERLIGKMMKMDECKGIDKTTRLK